MSSGLSSVAHHNPHINTILVFLFMQELFIDKIHYFKFLCMSDKPRLHQLNIITSSSPWLPEVFHWYGEIPSRKGKWPMLRTNTKPHQVIKHAKISYSIVSLVFCEFRTELTEMVETDCFKAEVFQVSQKVRTVLVRYLLSGIGIFIYPCTRYSTSKIYLCLEDNRSSFSRLSLQVIIFASEFKIRN